MASNSRDNIKAENDGRTDEAKGTDAEAATPECDGGSICDVHDIPIPPDGGWGWMIVLSSFMCNLIVDGIAYTFGVFLPILTVYFGEGKGRVSMIGSLLAGVYLSCGPIVSALTNKFGCRTTCVLGSVVGCLAFVLSTLSNSVTMLMITYGVIGGIGFGLIYLPAIVSVGYYFEKRRAFATGIAVCGSGFGTFIFAPVANLLLEHFDWKGANLLLAGLILNCAVFGALMRPLVAPKKQCKPLLQRMAEDKALQMERGSLMGSSYFMVQLPDGSYEKRLKVPVNVDPGVHSSFNLDELAQPAQPAGATLLYPTGPTLPTISEARVSEAVLESSSGSSSEAGAREVLESPEKEEKQLINTQLKETLEEANQCKIETNDDGKLTEDHSKSSAVTVMRNSGSVVNGDATTWKRRSGASGGGSKDDVNSMSASRTTLTKAEKKDLARPLARKDVFYSGSVTNLPEYQSKKSLGSYRQSIISLPRAGQPTTGRKNVDKNQGGCCSCLPESVRSSMTGLMDFSLMKDPVFLFLGVSNIISMLGFYVPYVYIIDAAMERNIESDAASFLLSIIGITNTVGRIIAGWLSDFPFVDSLFVTNVCIAVSGLALFIVPFCYDYASFCVAASIFGFFSSAFIALTSIVLVDLLGIQQLTNAFGLLCLLRGVAAIVGPPLAGSVFDATQSYDVPFWLAGMFLFIAAAISFLIPCVRRFLRRRENKIKEQAGDPKEMKELLKKEDVPRVVQTQATPQTSPVKV